MKKTRRQDGVLRHHLAAVVSLPYLILQFSIIFKKYYKNILTHIDILCIIIYFTFDKILFIRYNIKQKQSDYIFEEGDTLVRQKESFQSTGGIISVCRQ